MPTDPTLAPPRPSIPLDPTSIPAMLLDPSHQEWSHPTPFPEFITSFRPHQVQAVEEIVDAFTRSPVVILDAPVGCLSGDTMIGINRGGKGYQCRIDELVTKFNGGYTLGAKNSKRRWDLRIPTYVQRAVGGVMQLGRLVGAYESGEKQTFTLTTTAGHVIRATAEHPFMLDDGTWVKLGNLNPGDNIRVLGEQGGGSVKAKQHYVQVSRMKNHPHAVRHGKDKGPWRVAEHRLVVEAALNGIEYEAFLNLIQQGHIGGLRFLDPAAEHVHHVNHDRLDNRIENLVVVDPHEHWRDHATRGGWQHVQHRIWLDTIESITAGRLEPTYDLEVADDPHNFIANGFVVHNSGKTLIAEMVRRIMRSRSIFCCTTKSLQDQFLCIDPETPILTEVLEWVAAGTISVGDGLLGFDEERSPNRRMWRRSVVEEVVELQKERVLLEFEDGSSVICTPEHRWLIRVGQSYTRWVRTEDLRVGDHGYASKILKAFEPWGEGRSWEHGHLAAAFDGEGHLHQGDPARGNGYDVNLSFAQKKNEMLDVVLNNLDRLGFRYHMNISDRDQCARVTLSGRQETLRFLGEVRPARILPQLDLDRLGMINPLRKVAVVKRTPLGLGTVLAIRTSTRTYMANGFASHNCDFTHSRVLKGRANYPTQYGEFPEVTAADCTARGYGDTCMWCDGKQFCGYTSAKRDALQAITAVLNTAYFLTEANGPGAFGSGPPGSDMSKSNARELVVLDEADELESALMGFVEVEVGPWWRKVLRVDLPQVKTEKAKSNDWQDWVDTCIERLQEHMMGLETHPTEVRAIRHRQRAGNLLGKLRILAEELPQGGWIYDGYNRKDPTAIFRPVKVDQFGGRYLWRHGQKFLLMSGSVISPGEMADSLGIGSFESVNVRLDWDPQRRPVFVCPVANVTYKEKEAAHPELAKAVYHIAERHPGESILVHTVSYHLTKYLATALDGVVDRPLIWYEQGSDRDEALATFKATPGSMILAPSLDRGIDLPDDLCRVMVICKVPWPSMGDKQTKTRANMGRKGKLWYSVRAVRTIVQMLGRGMRHEEDGVVTYILDEQIHRILRKKALVPEYVKAAVVDGPPPWDQSRPLPRPMPI